MDGFQQVRALVAVDALDAALDGLAALAPTPDLSREVVLLRAGLQRAKKRERQGTLSNDEIGRDSAKLASALLSLVDACERASPLLSAARVAPVPAATSDATRSVFISYSHTDQTLARQLRDALRERRIQVAMDVDNLDPGEEITGFIRRSIRETDLTVAIISSASLSSSWVVFEVVNTLNLADMGARSRLVACSTDQRFFSPGFRLEVTGSIDARIAEIDGLVPDYVARRIDFTEISVERTRLLNMRAALGQVLDYLKGTLTLTLAADTLPATADRIAAHLLQAKV